MANYRRGAKRWIGCSQRRQYGIQRRILVGLVRDIISPLKFNPNREVIATLATFERRSAGMPSAPIKRYELGQMAVAPNDQMR